MLNKTHTYLKERMFRKSVGLQQFERMPMAAIRVTELLKSGLDLSNDTFNLKRSISITEPKNNFFKASLGKMKNEGGRIRQGSEHISSDKNAATFSNRESDPC